jgi:hypothetical protein
MVTLKIHKKLNQFEAMNGMKPEVLILGRAVYRKLCEESINHRRDEGSIALTAFRGASIVVLEDMDILIDCGTTGSMAMLSRCQA